MKTAACLRFAWSAFCRHCASLLLIGASIAASQMIVHGALRALGSGLVPDAIELVVSGMFVAGWFNACRRAALGRRPRLQDAFAPFVRRPGPFLGVSVLVSAGALLAGVGVLLTAFMFVFSPLLLCEGEPLAHALLHSKRLVVQHPWPVLGLLGALLVLNALGALLLGVGLLVTTPISVLALIGLRLELAARAPDAGVARLGMAH